MTNDIWFPNQEYVIGNWSIPICHLADSHAKQVVILRRWFGMIAHDHHLTLTAFKLNGARLTADVFKNNVAALACDDQ